MKNGKIGPIFTAPSALNTATSNATQRRAFSGARGQRGQALRWFCLAALLLPVGFFISSPSFASPLISIIEPTVSHDSIPPLVFSDAEGITHALSDYKGRYVLLSLWATWCPPCKKEMPSLEKLQKNFDPKKLTVIPLSEDSSLDTVSVFYAQHNVTGLPIAYDQAHRAPAVFQIHGLPTTILIDPQGREISRTEGSIDWMSSSVQNYLREQTGIAP